MNKIICLLFIIIPISSFAQTTAEKPKILYGVCTKDSLMGEPFGKWFTTGYDSYIANTDITTSLKKQDLDNISIKIFFGTWCGDSKREVPRFLKLLSDISFPGKKVQLIALGGGDSLVKQSPTHEETGLGIFRVPTFIIYKNGKEVNRINEFPVFSLEKDLLNILNDPPYSPNYHSFKTILQWLNDGSLTDGNNSVRGLAEQLRPLVADEHELNSLGYLLLKQGKKKEALQIFRMNYTLYPESANIASSLGEGYYENNDFKKAITLLERSLELNKDPKAIKDILTILYKAKEKE
ncbi:MAG: tetratricopeptide repeat protein [Chitinophagaceae bacterium]|nr:tetratricopeptide repeat protein [Chitinophagaceae bacterium]